MGKSLPGSSRAVANWIWLGVGMLLIQVVLGGITRLTGSGLSITEWNVVTGAIPPLNQQQWLTEFDKYRKTPQFNLLHADFQLSDFKFIFFWEWFHRAWARLVGVIFIVGFVWLVWKKQLTGNMIRPLLILFLLGALQGAVGWIMVQSGLTGDAIYVEPTRLALHFIFALGLISYAFWFALTLSVPPKDLHPDKGLARFTWMIIFFVFFQLLFGALMAGHRAAAAASTWPTINGQWIPASLFREKPAPINLVENPITIQFVHRGLAYIILACVLVFFIRARRITGVSNRFSAGIRFPVAAVLLQVALGILAVLGSPTIQANHWGPFEWIAQAHQVIGMLFLLSLLNVLYLVRRHKGAIMTH
ncbi:MAG TPA: COX15/CtaA family protein [Puia sp.]|nr:COX15/CtaA family protein [Puia sp.]